MKQILLFLSIIGVMATASAAQVSPYIGEENQAIKSLTREQIEGLQSGQGMGYAKAAELNHYPGPRHVLDLASELALTDKQLSATELLFQSMKNRAVKLGNALIEQERILDRLFANQSVSEALLESQLTTISQLEARIRYVHLSTHLSQVKILTQHQVKLYDKLRGYSTGKHTHTH